jgi:putative ABC transport system permease protein
VLPLSYSLRNVAARPARSLMTASVIALVVVASSLFLGLISSLKRTLVSSGDPLNLIVMRKGSDNDGSSWLPLEAYQALRFLDGVARDAADQPLASPELVVQPFFRTLSGGRENVLVRGVEPVALAVHSEVKVVEGRMFTPSSREVVVGRGVVGRYSGAALGSDLEFGRGTWKVVGILESGGSSFESEVWADVRELASDAKRGSAYSGVSTRGVGPVQVAESRSLPSQSHARFALIRPVSTSKRYP